MTSKTKAVTDATTEWLRVDRLTVDKRYQRPLSMTAVRIISENFDPDALGSLLVSRRADGTLVLLDGQQRHGALMHMGYGDQTVPCVVHDGLTLEEEAALFTRLNVDRSRPHPVDIFRARVVAGETEAVSIQAILDEVGVRTLAKSGEFMALAAVSAVETIYRIGGAPLLTWTLRSAIESWGGEKGCFGAGVMLGLAMFRKTYPSVARAELTRKLGRQQPRELESKARQIRALEGGNIAACMARIMVGAYNWRREEDGKLDAGKIPAKFVKAGFGNVSGPAEAKRKSAQVRRERKA